MRHGLNTFNLFDLVFRTLVLSSCFATLKSDAILDKCLYNFLNGAKISNFSSKFELTTRSKMNFNFQQDESKIKFTIFNSTIYLARNQSLFSLNSLVFLWNHQREKYQFLDEDLLLELNFEFRSKSDEWLVFKSLFHLSLENNTYLSEFIDLKTHSTTKKYADVDSLSTLWLNENELNAAYTISNEIQECNNLVIDFRLFRKSASISYFQVTELMNADANFANQKEQLRKMIIIKLNSIRSSNLAGKRRKNLIHRVKRDEETITSSDEQDSRNTTKEASTTTNKLHNFHSNPEFIKFTAIVTACLSVLFGILFLIIHCCNKDLVIEIIDKVKQFLKKVWKK